MQRIGSFYGYWLVIIYFNCGISCHLHKIIKVWNEIMPSLPSTCGSLSPLVKCRHYKIEILIFYVYSISLWTIFATLLKKKLGSKGRRVFRNMYKGHMDKTKGRWDQGWEVEMVGVGGVAGGKWRQLYLNNNKKKSGKNIRKLVQHNQISVDPSSP